MYNNPRMCDISNEILRIRGVREGLGLQRAKEHANNVKQCCKVCKKPVCKKHTHKTSGVTCCNHLLLTSWIVAIDACYILLASQWICRPMFFITCRNHKTIQICKLNSIQ